MSDVQGTIEDYVQNTSPRQIANELRFAGTLASSPLEYKLAALLIIEQERVKLRDIGLELSNLLGKESLDEVRHARAIVAPLVEQRK